MVRKSCPNTARVTASPCLSTSCDSRFPVMITRRGSTLTSMSLDVKPEFGVHPDFFIGFFQFHVDGVQKSRSLQQWRRCCHRPAPRSNNSKARARWRHSSVPFVQTSFDLGGLYGWAGRRRLRCSCDFSGIGGLFRSLFLVFRGTH